MNQLYAAAQQGRARQVLELLQQASECKDSNWGDGQATPLFVRLHPPLVALYQWRCTPQLALSVVAGDMWADVVFVSQVASRNGHTEVP